MHQFLWMNPHNEVEKLLLLSSIAHTEINLSPYRITRYCLEVNRNAEEKNSKSMTQYALL